MLLSRSLLALIGLGALAALGGGYFDDAWHTERGRDTFFIAPHLAIYGGVSAAAAGVGLWALRVARAEGWRRALRTPPVAMAATGLAVTLASAPVDNAWHVAFGRDAVIWSPPHVLGIVGTGGLAAAVGLALAEDPRRRGGPAVAPVGALLLAALAFLTVEYETDVPQFAARWYLPVLAVGAALALAVVGRLDPRPLARTRAAGWHLGFVAAVAAALAAAGFDAPRLPVLVAPALALDLARRAGMPRGGRAAAGALALVAVAVPLGHVGRGVRLDAADAALGLALAWAAFAAVEALVEGPRPRRRAAGPGVATAVALVALVLPAVALAHDPGQGPDAGTLDLAVSVDESATATVLVRAAPGRRLAGRGLVARRGGVERRAGLRSVAPGRWRGTVALDDRGRWLVYAQLRRPDGRTVEAWLPVRGDLTRTTRDAGRFAYLADRRPSSGWKWGAGVALYLLTAGYLGALLLLVRRSGPTRPATASG